MNADAAGVLRETVRDYLINQQFRRDLFTRGARRLAPLEAHRAPQRHAPDPARSGRGHALRGGRRAREDRPEAVYKPVIDALAANNYAVKTLGQIARTSQVSNCRRAL